MMPPDRPGGSTPDRLGTIAAFVPFVVFLAVYGSAAGKGFIADDFGWILNSRVRTLSDLAAVCMRADGFYRPVVSLTFSANELAFGVHPFWYGLTNVALACLCGLSLYSFCRALALSRGSALLAAALWLLNFHGISMAVLWVSGRTALVLTLAATSMGAALLRGRVLLALVWLMVALFSKEEAVLLPLVMTAWLGIWRPHWTQGRPLSWLRWLLASGAAAAVYLGVRATTNAMTPASAPWYYRFTIDPIAIARNGLEYADRTLTVSVAAIVVACLLLRRLPGRPDRRTASLLAACAVWLIGAYGVTIFLPVRSSLYACLPSVGAVVASAALVMRAWARSSEPCRRHALLAAILIPVVLAPVHWSRTGRWRATARFSSSVLEDLRAHAADLRDGSNILIHDDRSNRANMESAFGTLLDEAFVLADGRRMTFWIEPLLDGDPQHPAPLCAGCADLELTVRAGHLVRTRPRQ